MRTELEANTVVDLGCRYVQGRRFELAYVAEDGTRHRTSPAFIERTDGLDAVRILLTRQSGGKTEVLLRDDFRPAVSHWSRLPELIPVPEEPIELTTGLISGCIERLDKTDPDPMEGVRRRAALEIQEETGITVEPAALVVLGSYFPAPGILSERVWILHAPVPAGTEAVQPDDNPNPDEWQHRHRWVEVNQANAECLHTIVEAGAVIAIKTYMERAR